MKEKKRLEIRQPMTLRRIIASLRKRELPVMKGSLLSLSLILLDFYSGSAYDAICSSKVD